MKILYSFNKKGAEARIWTDEIRAASADWYEFVPFNHDPYLDSRLYLRAQQLDNLYFDRNAGLMEMYRDVVKVIDEQKPDVLVVDNAMPYHPEFLRKLNAYKVLRTSDGPLAAYDRDFAYTHAYDHVLYHSPAYSPDLNMAEKLAYVGAKRTDFWPLAVFDSIMRPEKNEETIMAHERDIDVVFIGSAYLGKLPMFARLQKALGRRLHMHGNFGFKYNAYYNLKYGMPGWVRPVAAGDPYINTYQRAKIGFNVHNRGDYTVGNYRMFELPANGVMQISEGGEYLNQFFEVGKEIVRYSTIDELIDKIHYYLKHDDERKEIALNGYRRTMRDHRFKKRMREAAELIRAGMEARG